MSDQDRSQGNASKAEVFISYSRCQLGDEPNPENSGAVHNWRSRRIAIDLLALLEEALQGKGYDVWRDQHFIVEGDLIGQKIDAALLSCAGAIILLDPDALCRSSWVFWESGILTWRERIQMPVKVVPVLIGVDPERLDEHGYGPSRLGQALAHIVNPDLFDFNAVGYLVDLAAHRARLLKPLGTWRPSQATPAHNGLTPSPSACHLGKAGSPPLSRCSPAVNGYAFLTRKRTLSPEKLLAADPDGFELILNAFFGFPFNDSSRLSSIYSRCGCPWLSRPGSQRLKIRNRGHG